MTTQDTLIIACPHCHTKNKLPAAKLKEQATCGRCKEPLHAGKPIELGLNNYQAHMTSDLPIVVDFWAPWCGPCLQFAPLYEQVASQWEPGVQFTKINTQNETVLGQRYNIRSIPTIAVFYKEQELARQAGVIPPSQLTQWLQQVLAQV